MYCENCGAQNTDGNAFCMSCGSALSQPAGNTDFAQNPNGQYNANQFNNGQSYTQQNGFTNMNAGYAPNTPNAPITNRSIGICILLSIITCGIYGIYWMYCLTEDTNAISNEPSTTSGGMAILLTIVTCGIYSFFWAYKRGEYIDNYYVRRGHAKPSNSVVYLVLSIFGLSIIAYCLAQNELNKISQGLV